jgi:acetoin utilization deacetylase AcuC-like enzyme
MSLLVLASERFVEHMTPPGHPERYQRAQAMDAVAARWREQGGAMAAPEPASREALERVHDGPYLDRLEVLRGRSAMLDADTFTSPETQEVALVAAGAAVASAGYALAGRGPAFAMVRPPGHHAGRDRAMGFCLYNNVAVAAAEALARGASKVAVVDIDVHHGNGTQDIFYDDPRVLYVSTHQHPFYPGTGLAAEAGHGAGLGFTVNIPMAAGATDADYSLVQRAVIDPVLEAFAPDLLLVSAGFDAHERDPLGGMRVTTGGYLGIIRHLRAFADRRCAGRIALVTEGGYDLEALAACCQGSIETLAAPIVTLPTPPGGPTDRADAAIADVLVSQRTYWAGL